MEVAVREPPKDVVFSTFDSETSLPGIMSLVEKDLSEPYSVFTYRYFVHTWPDLTIIAREKADNSLLGVIVCKADRLNRRKRFRGYIAMLAVDKDHRKRGIGSFLAYQAILKMRDMQCDEVVLETELTNSGALSLYEKLGFTKDKRLCRYYLNGGDAFRLKLWFTSPSWDDGVPAEDAVALQPDVETSTHLDTRDDQATNSSAAKTDPSTNGSNKETQGAVDKSMGGKKGKKKKGKT